MMGDAGPIGLIDSGWGGLSVALALRRELPGETLLYAGDHAFCPYGGRDEATIRERALFLTGALARRGAKAVVIACNTASSIALEDVRAAYGDLAVVGVVPAVKPGAAQSRSGRIAVLATPATASGSYLAGLVRDHAGSVEVEIVPAPGLVELVERGVVAGPEAEEAVRALLAGPLSRGADVVVLGCTHYPFLREAIAAVAGPEVRIVDSGDAIARRTRQVLDWRGQLAPAGREGGLRLFTTGDPEAVACTAAALLGERAEVERL